LRLDELQMQIDEFVTRLEERADEKHGDRAALARLKRCAGRPLAECRDVMPLFYRLLPAGVSTWAEANYFLVAGLFPFAPRKWTQDPEGDGRRQTDFGRSLRWLADQERVNADGVDRRLTVLLDASAEELPFRLRQAVRMLAQKEGLVDWRQLLLDLHHWERSDRPVQKRWARSYFGLRADAPEDGAPDPRAQTDDTQPMEINDAH
jgi:CRISPR system Cascade subunit CasB